MERESKFQDREMIDQHVLGELRDRMVKQFEVCPQNLRLIQYEVDAYSKTRTLPYRIKATIRRGKGGFLNLLHLIKDPRRV